jgi:hypothetical protein
VAAGDTRVSWKGCGFGCALLFVAALAMTSCDSERVVTVTGGPDSLTAVLEGMVGVGSDSFDVTLHRGGAEAKTVTHGGYFQFKDVEYGLYILTVTGKGFGEYRRLVYVNASHLIVDRIELHRLPWPLSQWTPTDSLVLKYDLPAKFYVMFSRPMDRHSVESAIQVEPPVAFRIGWETSNLSMGDVLTIAFDNEDLGSDVAYRIIMDTTAKTRDGGNLERPVTYSVVNRMKSDARNGLVSLLNAGQQLDPADTILIRFSKPMDISTVTGRLYVIPKTSMHQEWDLASSTLRLIPDTHWPLDKELEFGLNAGYRTKEGVAGGDVSGTLSIGVFDVVSPRTGTITTFSTQFAMDFNLPIDLSSLRHSQNGSITATAIKVAPNRLLWSFGGVEKDAVFTLRIDSLVSVFGNEMEGALSFMLQSDGSSVFRTLDSSQGLAPFQDTLRLETTWAAYTRLKDSTFRMAPDYPVIAKWSAPSFNDVTLKIAFPQPIPSGTAFMLFPNAGASVGDSVSFKTQELSGTILRPFYGEENVMMGEDIAFHWNTRIDTADFVSHLTMDPDLDSLHIIQDTSGGKHRTVIRHSGFARNTAYTVKLTGVTDVFSRPMRDTLMLRFRTAP